MAEVQGQADELQLGLGIAWPPQRDQAEVVSQPPVHRVVVEGVAEIEHQRAAPPPPGSVKDMCRVARDQIGARLL